MLALVLLVSCGDGSDPGRSTAPTDRQENAAGGPTMDPGELPDVVMILIDTLRPDHLDLYGYPRETAPYLRQLGERSAVFENAFSTSSWTAPATASLFTGQYPTRHGIVEGWRANRRREREIRQEIRKTRKDVPREEAPAVTVVLNRMATDRATLPELLQQKGYRTFGFATNVNIDEAMGFHRGFDRFECVEKTYAPDVFEKVKEWEDEILAAEPSFLYLHFMDVHVPYHERGPWYEKGRDHVTDAMARYDSEIRFLDEHLADLHQRLGWDDSTVLWFLSDHGEEFMEHGQIGHHYSLHSEVNRVLMMCHAPFQGVVARRIERNVSLIDVLPTLLDQLGDPTAGLRDGMTLVPLMLAQVADETDDVLAERTLFAHRLDRKPEDELQLWSAIRGHWRLIENHDGSEPRLYHMNKDRDEQNNLAGARPKVVAGLRAQLETLRQEGIQNFGGSVEVEVDEDMLEVLRELGYVDDGE